MNYVDRPARVPTTGRPDRELIVEIADRVRRMETRLVRFLESQGFDTQTQKPVLVDGTVRIPTPNCSLADILDVIPFGHHGSVPITVGNELIATLGARGAGSAVLLDCADPHDFDPLSFNQGENR